MNYFDTVISDFANDFVSADKLLLFLQLLLSKEIIQTNIRPKITRRCYNKEQFVLQRLSEILAREFRFVVVWQNMNHLRTFHSCNRANEKGGNKQLE